MEVGTISSICLKTENFENYEYADDGDAIRNLSRINIFIGANNSGKSRFMRKILADTNLQFNTIEFDMEKIKKNFLEFKAEYEKVSLLEYNRNSYHYNNIRYEFDKIELTNYLSKVNNWQSISIFLNEIERKHRIYSGFESAETWRAYRSFESAHRSFFATTNLEINSIYIPTLRGLRPIQITGSDKDSFHSLEDNYLHRTTTDYFAGSSNLIYTGLSLYKDLQAFSHGSIEQQKMYNDFNDFLSETFFEGKKVRLTPRYQKDVIHVQIGDNEEPIYNLGDGIQSLIILTYPLFFNRDKKLKVFIEEPETHLHPGFQKILIDTFQKEEFKHFQFFITTHSNHFLDLTLDANNISVYTFEQQEERRIKITNVENSDTNILSLIGVRNSSVFLSNCTIWVEGITDRIYIRKYLEILQKGSQKKFKEDVHFSFVEYGGNNITHWSFLDSDDPKHSNILVDRLCGKLFLITDRDNTEFKNGKLPKNPSKKALRLKQLKEKLKERFFCLSVKEIENLLPPTIIKNVIADFEKKKVTDLDFQKLVYEDYKNKSLGDFIETNFKKVLKKNYRSDSGTINNKVEFAKKAVKYMENEDNLSKDAIAMTKKILAFIEKMNS